MSRDVSAVKSLKFTRLQVESHKSLISFEEHLELATYPDIVVTK